MPKAAPTLDADMPFKLRARTLLWALGYHSPLEVAVSVYNDAEVSRKRWDVTDIDVLGIRFDTDLSLRTVLADCKSGHESTPNRLFWLRGLMDLFGADEAYLLKAEIHEHGRLLAPKLGIRAMTSDDLAVIERMADTSAVHPVIGAVAAYEKTAALWKLDVAKGSTLTATQRILKQAYAYLNYRFWFIEEHRNVLTLISVLQQTKDALDPADPRARLLALVALQRFLLSLLRVARAACSRRPGAIAEEAHQYVFGGGSGQSVRERKQLIDLLNEVRGATPRIELEPPFFPELLEIVNRIVMSAAHAKSLLRHLDGIVAEEVNNTKAEDVLGDEWSLDAAVLAKRAADLLVTAAGVRRELFSTLMAK